MHRYLVLRLSILEMECPISAQFSRHCVLNGNTQHSALSCYESGMPKKKKFSRVGIEPTTVAFTQIDLTHKIRIQYKNITKTFITKPS